MYQSSSSDACLCHYNIEILNLFNPKLQLFNTRTAIKNKLKDLLDECEKFKAQATSVLE